MVIQDCHIIKQQHLKCPCNFFPFCKKRLQINSFLMAINIGAGKLRSICISSYDLLTLFQKNKSELDQTGEGEVKLVLYWKHHQIIFSQIKMTTIICHLTSFKKSMLLPLRLDQYGCQYIVSANSKFCFFGSFGKKINLINSFLQNLLKDLRTLKKQGRIYEI